MLAGLFHRHSQFSTSLSRAVLVVAVSLAVLLVAVVLVVSARMLWVRLQVAVRQQSQVFLLKLELITQSQSVLVVQETQETQELKAQMGATLS
jgi:hypothetical protein